MGVGGICNAALAREMLRPGVELLQIYGYVFRDPDIAPRNQRFPPLGLSLANFGVPRVLADPLLELNDSAATSFSLAACFD